MQAYSRLVVRGSAAFVIMLASIMLFPLLAFAFYMVMPERASEFLFFFPQLAFGYSQLAWREARNSYVLPGSAGTIVSILQWAILAVGFGLTTARLTRPSLLFPLAMLVILIFTATVHWLLGVFGLGVEVIRP